MENFDANVEQQVWQRVFAQPEQKREDLRPLVLAAMEAAAAYRELAGMLAGSRQEQAKRLYQEQQSTVTCLRGMQRLSGSGGEPPKALPRPREPAQKLLEKNYHRAKRAMTEYTARSLDSEFGVVFQHLAQREGEHCVMIARLLGQETQSGRA